MREMTMTCPHCHLEHLHYKCSQPSDLFPDYYFLSVKSPIASDLFQTAHLHEGKASRNDKNFITIQVQPLCIHAHFQPHQQSIAKLCSITALMLVFHNIAFHESITKSWQLTTKA